MSQFNVNVTRAQQSIVVPDTGANQMESMGGGITSGLLPVAIFTLFAVLAVAVCLHKKFKAKSFFILKKYKRLAFAIPSILLIVGVITYCIATKIATTNAIDTDEPQDRNTLSITAEDINIDVHIEDEAVYAMAPSKVTVNSGTDFGYTLMAYIDNNDLVSDNGNKISGLDPSINTKLQDNTWGVATVLPESQNSEVFHGLPTTAKDAIVLRSHPDVATTEAGEETTVYYGVYVTPELEEGVYSGTTINYIAVSDFTDQDIAITYLGNGLYFDEEQTQKSNTVIYRRNCEEATAEGDEQSCSFSVSKGQYQSPIGYQGSWVMFNETYQIEDDDTVTGYLNYLNEEQNGLVTSILGRNISMLATNDKTNILVFLGNFVDGSDNMLDQINILSYTYDENAAIDDRQPTLVEGEYIRPVNFSGTWYVDFTFPLSEEVIQHILKNANLGQKVIISQYYDGPAADPIWIEYDANAEGDIVDNMPSSEEQPYDAIDGHYVISDQTPSRNGYTFTGWYFDYTGVTYQPGEEIWSYFENDTIWLRAQWEEEVVYTINYFDNFDLAAGDVESLCWSGDARDCYSWTETCTTLDGCTLSPPRFNVDEYSRFDCWLDYSTSQCYSPGSQIPIDSSTSIDLYALRTQVAYSIIYHYDSDGLDMEHYSPCSIDEGCTVDSAPAPTEECLRGDKECSFTGWLRIDVSDDHYYQPGERIFPTYDGWLFMAEWEVLDPNQPDEP